MAQAKGPGTTRRVGQIGQFDIQACSGLTSTGYEECGNSHVEKRCCMYRLVRCMGAGQWVVERLADGHISIVQFVSAERYSRHF